MHVIISNKVINIQKEMFGVYYNPRKNNNIEDYL